MLHAYGEVSSLIRKTGEARDRTRRPLVYKAGSLTARPRRLLLVMWPGPFIQTFATPPFRPMRLYMKFGFDWPSSSEKMFEIIDHNDDGAWVYYKHIMWAWWLRWAKRASLFVAWLFAPLKCILTTNFIAERLGFLLHFSYWEFIHLQENNFPKSASQRPYNCRIVADQSSKIAVTYWL